MIYKFSKELYSKEALIKAAYTFIDDFYIHLDVVQNEYIVTIDAKDNICKVSMEEFKNEILIQETRLIINEQNKKIREILYSRAMASTIIEENKEDEIFEEENAEEILVDWFEEYE